MNRIQSLACILLLVSCGGGGGYDSPTAPRGPSVVTIQVKENTYEPRSVTIQPGDTVRWVMAGSDPSHTVTARNGEFDSGTVFTGNGAAFERTFGTAGLTYEYSCKEHSDCCNMKGSIRVGDSAPRPSNDYE